MQTSGKTCRENAASYSVVVTRLVRNCALGRVTQYSRDNRDRTDEPRRTGSSACAEDDSGVGMDLSPLSQRRPACWRKCAPPETCYNAGRPRRDRRQQERKM